MHSCNGFGSFLCNTHYLQKEGFIRNWQDSFLTFSLLSTQSILLVLQQAHCISESRKTNFNYISMHMTKVR